MAIHLDRSDGEYAIWTDCEGGSRYTGRVVGIGDTLDEAKADAISDLQGEIAAVHALMEGATDAIE